MLVAYRPDSLVASTLQKAQSQGKSLKSFIFAVNLQVPDKDHYSVVFYFATDDVVPPGSLLYRFINGDDSFRNQRFKIVKGSWIVKAVVGNYEAQEKEELPERLVGAVRVCQMKMSSATTIVDALNPALVAARGKAKVNHHMSGDDDDEDDV